VSGSPLLGIVTYHSPLPVFRPLEAVSLAVFPAAAEAKLEVKGEGMLVYGNCKVPRMRWSRSCFDRGLANNLVCHRVLHVEVRRVKIRLKSKVL